MPLAKSRCPECNRPLPCGRTHRDPCLVPAEPFAELVRDYIERWNRERPQPGGQFREAGAGPKPIQAIVSLAAETSVARGTIEALLTRGPGSRAIIELGVADAIATALHRLDVFYGVVVYRNPRARGEGVACLPTTGESVPELPEHLRLACCAGSSRPTASADPLLVAA